MQFEKIINGHEIILNIDIDTLDTIIADDVIMRISDLTLNVNEGTITFENENNLNWRIKSSIDLYLDEKVEILKNKGEVVFEYDCMIYTISESSEGGYEINVYDLHTDNFISGDTLDADDGGHCTGNARDAVCFNIM